MSRRDRVLSWYLRAYAVGLLVALPATIVPTSWLAAAHEAIWAWGRGPICLCWSTWRGRRPRPTPASVPWPCWRRSTCGVTGCSSSFWVCSACPAGSISFVLGLLVKLPWWWTALEGPGVILTSLPLLLLSRPSSS